MSCMATTCVIVRLMCAEYCPCLLAGEVTAVEALRQACQSLKQLCGHMKSAFTEAYEQHEQSKDAQPMPDG